MRFFYMEEFVNSETEYFYNLYKKPTEHTKCNVNNEYTGNFFENFLRQHFTAEQIALLPEIRSTAQVVRQANLEALDVYKNICLQRKLAPAVPSPNISDERVYIHHVLTPPSAQLQAIAAAIAEIGGTRNVTLRSFAYTDEAVADLLRAASGRERRPTEISISECLLGERAMDAIFRHHADPAGMELESLSLVNCGIGQATSQLESHFAGFLATELPDLLTTEIPVSLPVFLFLRYSWSIKKLDISGNILSLSATKLLGWALIESGIERIVLDNCGLTNETILPIAQALGTRNKTVTELSIQENIKITDLGEFCRNVVNHNRLQHLKMQGVTIKDADAFVDMLMRSPNLVAVHAFGVIGDEESAKEVVARIYAANKVVVDFDVPDDSNEFVFYRVPQLPAFEKWRVAFESKPLTVDCFSNECHVCGGFVRHDFVYTTNHPRVMTVGLVSSFSPGNVLDLQRTSSGFIVSLLVPPGKHFYAFCINGDLTKLTVSRQDFFVRVEPGMTLSEELRLADFVNVIEGTNAANALGKARNANEYATEAAEGRLDESKTAMKRCLEKDMEIINFKEICSQKEEADVRKMIVARFNLLNEVFTIFAARHRNFPIIKQSNVARFFELCELVETETLSKKRSEDFSAYQGVLTRQEIQQIIDQTFSAFEDVQEEEVGLEFQQRILMELSKLRKEKLAKTIHRPVTRVRFIEILLRASVFVLAKVRQCKTLSEQFAYICDKMIEPIFVRPPLAPFSRAHLANSEIVKLLTRLVPDSTAQDDRSVFRQIFMRFAESQDSFIRLAHILRLQDKVFTTDDVRAVFALSKIPQVDGMALDNPRLSYPEFVEAFCRLALVYKFQKSQRAASGKSSKSDTSSLSVKSAAPTEKAGDRWRKAVVGAGEKGDKQIDILAKTIETFYDFTVAKMRSAINQV